MIGQEEIKLVEGLTTFISEKPIIFDIGCNKGHWADIMLKEFGDNCTIYAFEPVHKLINFLEIKYEYKTNIIFNELAASGMNGSAMFYYFENFNNELSSLHKQDWWEVELPMKEGIVKTVRIDTYCKSHSIDYIDYLKIDTEGADAEVLSGCYDMMANGRIGIIQIEYGGHYQISKNTFVDVIKKANTLGYSVYSFTGENYNKVELESFIEDYHYENYIITREEIHDYSVDGWNKEFIESVKDLPKINFFLEVGTFEGYTTKWICENLLEKGGRCICIDPLEDEYIKGDADHPFFKGQYKRFLRTVKGLPVELRRKNSRDELPRMHAFRFDLIYIDGDHREFYVYHDGCDCFKILKVGGYLLFDDYKWRDDTTNGIDRFLSEHEARYEIIGNGYQILIKKTSD